MGNEMGNNNTSGLSEEDNTVEDKPVQGFDHADDLKGPNRVVPATGDKEEVTMKTEGEKSLEDAGRTDYEKEQNNEVVASEDIHVNGKDEKEVKGQDNLVPAAEDINTRGNETEPAFLEHDGLASPLIEDWEHGDKEQDNSTILQVEEIPLNEAASTNETNAASLVPVVGHESTHGTETKLAFSGRDGTKYPCVDEQKHDEKAIEIDAEKSVATNDEAEEQSSKEAKEAKGQDRLFPGAEDKSTQGDEMESASLEHDDLTSTCSEDPKHDQKEQDTSTIDETEEIALKDSAITDETNAEARLVPAGGDGSTHRTEAGLILGDCDGMEHLCLDKLKPDDKEDDININDQTVEQSSQEAASTDVIDRQGQLLSVVDDKATYGNEKCLVSGDPEGTTNLHGDNSKEHEKEEDYNMIPVDKEDSMQEAGCAEEEKGQEHLFPAAEDKNAWVSEIGSASLDHDGLASPHIKDLEHGEKEHYTSTILEVEETSLKEGASTDETNAEGCLVPAGGDVSSHGTETGLVPGDHNGMEYPSVDDKKHDAKEEDITINDEAEEESSQEAASTDVLDRHGQVLAVVEGKTNNGNETGLVSSDPDGTADIHGDKLKEHEKEVNNTNAEPQERPLAKDDHEDDNEEKNLTIPTVEGEDCNNKEAELASGDLKTVGDTLHNQTLEGKEQAKPELDPPAESTEYDLEPSEVAGEYSETQPDSSLKNLEDHEMKKEPNSEENLSARTQHVESQKPMMEEGEGTNNSISGAASPISHESVPQEPVVILETEEHEPEGTTDLHGDNSKEHEKEEDYNMIPVDKEGSMQEAGCAEEEKGQEHLFPAAEDKNAWVSEIGSASLDHDGLASPHIKDLEHGEKDAEHYTSTILEVEETSLKEGASTDETNAEGCLVPAGGDVSSHGTETGLVLGDHNGIEYPSVDDKKHDAKEEDITINDEAEEESSQEAASPDVLDRQRQVLAVVEGKTNNGNETGLVSNDPDGAADIHGDKLKEHEKEVNNTNAEPQEKPLAKDDHEDDNEEKNLTNPAVEVEDCNNKEAELASGDLKIVGDTLHNQTLEGKEQAKTELDPPAESTEYDLEPSEVAGEYSETQPDSSLKNLEDHEMKKEPNSEENLSARTQHVESQKPMMEEGEGTSDSISDAASPTSHESVPQEPIVILETEEHELVEILTEQLVLECNGPVKSEDMIILSLTCCDQENGFLLDSSVSTDLVESVFPVRSPVAGKGRDVISVEEMASKRVSTEEKFELKDGDMLGHDIGTVTTVMTDLPMGVGAKCNGELPSEINSTKTDSPESEVEAILSNETQNILVEVSEFEFEEKDMVHNQKGTSVKEDSDNGKQAHCQIQSGEVLIEKTNVQRSEEGSTATDQSAFSHKFMMNGQATILENGHLVEQQKNSQREVQLATDSADTFPMDQINKREETEKKIIEDMIGKKRDTNPIANDTPRRENEEQFISHSYDPIEQTEAFLSPSPFLQALLEKQESFGEFSITEASSFVNKNLTQKIVVPIEFCGEKSLTLSETKVIASGDHNNQRESVERLSIESNPDNTTMRKSPSFDLDLRIDARAEDSDQTPLLYQDKATIDSFSSQPDINENGETPSHSQYESMAAQGKGVKLERSDSEKSKTSFLGFLKEDEEADNNNNNHNNMLMNPKKQEDQSATKKSTTSKVSVSVKVVTSGTTKGKVKRKPRASLFGTCMCCATV